MKWNKIASFEVNHNTLKRGIYTSRIDGDVVTYDIRMKIPNAGDYLSNPAMHTIEHLAATYLRNGRHKDGIIYFGPMGCRTGFYLLVRDISPADTVELVKETFAFIADFTGQIPGVSAAECGNYLEHDLAGAKKEAETYLRVIENYAEQQLKYER